MTKYKKLIKLVRSWLPKRQHFEKAMLGLALVLTLIKSWLPSLKDVLRAFLYIVFVVSTGYCFTIGAQLADRPIQITIENAE